MAKLGRTIVCCLIASASVGVLRADEPAFPDPGSRIRLRSSEPESLRLVGTLTAVDPESLTVTPEAGGKATAVARRDIVRLERSVSPSRRTTGAWIGFGVGLALAFGKAAAQGGCNDGCDSSNVLVGGLIAVSGAAVGAAIAPGENWSEVNVTRERSQLTTEREMGLAVRLVPQVGRRVGLSIVTSF